MLVTKFPLWGIVSYAVGAVGIWLATPAQFTVLQRVLIVCLAPILIVLAFFIIWLLIGALLKRLSEFSSSRPFDFRKSKAQEEVLVAALIGLEGAGKTSFFSKITHADNKTKARSNRSESILLPSDVLGVQDLKMRFIDTVGGDIVEAIKAAKEADILVFFFDPDPSGNSICDSDARLERHSDFAKNFVRIMLDEQKSFKKVIVVQSKNDLFDSDPKSKEFSRKLESVVAGSGLAKLGPQRRLDARNSTEAKALFKKVFDPKFKKKYEAELTA